MTVMDPIADMFTRIRNGINANLDEVGMPFSKIKLSLTKILREEGFIKYYDVSTQDLNRKEIKIGLKYDNNGRSLITEIKRVSRPGRRVYVKKKDVPKILNGFGSAFVSTSKGVVSGRNARLSNDGGEFLGYVF